MVLEPDTDITERLKKELVRMVRTKENEIGIQFKALVNKLSKKEQDLNMVKKLFV